jgi:hypothetical protein
MKVFGGFIKENITWLENDRIGIPCIIFNDNWPRFRILRAANMVDTGDHMGLGLIDVHPKPRFVSVEQRVKLH